MRLRLVLAFHIFELLHSLFNDLSVRIQLFLVLTTEFLKFGSKKNENLDFTSILPVFDLVPEPLKLLDLFFQIILVFISLIITVCLVHLFHRFFEQFDPLVDLQY